MAIEFASPKLHAIPQYMSAGLYRLDEPYDGGDWAHVQPLLPAHTACVATIKSLLAFPILCYGIDNYCQR